MTGPAKPSRKLFLFVLLAGIGVLGLLSLVPVWSAVAMLRDPVYMWFLGDGAPGAIVIFFPSVVLLYIFAVIALWGRAPLEARKQQNLLMLAMFFVTVLGAGCLIMAGPLRRRGEDFSDTVFTVCNKLGTFDSLTSTSQQLIQLRETPECAGKLSVELCEGYNRSSYTKVLKAMEETLHCSGWCQLSSLALPHSDGILLGMAVGVGGDVASLIQRGAVLSVERRSAARAAAGAQASPRPMVFSGGASPSPTRTSSPSSIPGRGRGGGSLLQEVLVHGASIAVGELPGYPPTLFSLANYQATCDGMAARSIKGVLSDTATELHYEGIALMFVPVAVGFLVIFGISKVPHPRASPAGEDEHTQQQGPLGREGRD